MRKFLLLAVLGGLAGYGLRAGPFTIPLYENIGTVVFTNAPQIDAFAFANYGIFAVQSAIPYDFQNTLNYTNRGSMYGYPGFRIDTTDDLGRRRPAKNFINEGDLFALGSAAYFGYSNLFAPSSLRISATNIVSRRTMTVGNSGLLRLEGQNLNLSRSGLEVLSIESFPWANAIYDLNDDQIPDSFEPDNAIYDEWWGAGVQDPPQNGPINTANIIRFFGGDILATAPRHPVTARGGFNGFQSFQTLIPLIYNTSFGNTGFVSGLNLTLTNFDGSLSNVFIPTNTWRQAVAVGVNDTNFQVRCRFFGGFGGLGGFRTAAVEFSSRTTNVVRNAQEVNALYFIDSLAVNTNTLILTNIDVWTLSARPIAYEVWRGPPEPFEFALGANGNTELYRNLVYEPGFSNILATNLFAAWGGSVDYLEARPPQVPGVTPTNLPGRIEIVGDTVDLTQTRVRGMGSVAVKAKHLVSSAGARVDCENLMYDLASTNGLLTVQSLTKESVDRVRGLMMAWTGLWTNQYALVLSNWFIDANTNYFNPVTNAIDVGIHVLILSADFFTRTQQVVVDTLTLRSTNVAFNDAAVLGKNFVVDGESFTLNGRISFTNALVNWVHTNAPSLRFFTNAGTLNVQDVANYGSDYPSGRHWTRFVNRANLNAVSHRIAADEYFDSGSIASQATHTMIAGAATLEGGRTDSGGDIFLFADDLKLRNHAVVARRALHLTVTNSLSDTGGGANNQLSVQDGLHLWRKPLVGDLLGTRVDTTAPRFFSTFHSWAAEDRGPSRTGFKDNAAIGRLILKVFPFGELRFGKPLDAGGLPLPGNFALYVDYLELDPSVRADLEGTVAIDPGMTIYFANANVPVESLDGRFEGRLRWVRDFAGPASSAEVASRMGGNVIKTLRVNLALLDSKVIDSDADGLANGFDNWPFDGIKIRNVRVANPSPFTVEITFDAAARTTYFIESTSSLSAPDWRLLQTLTNNSDRIETRTVTEVLSAPVERQRYYRVRYDL
ncbi:MAG: hypothetical protein FJ387_00550 [Verrucomicrobia bacterium]|nr:hypothetical protein [Verrucomicrobiota bacterium]